MEYWSFGVMDENRTEEYRTFFKVGPRGNLYSVKVFGPYQIQEQMFEPNG